MPYIGNSPGTGTRNRFIYTATASQTTFSGADDNGKTLRYSDGDYVDVYLNGICLVPVDDYAATSKTSIVLTVGAAVNDTLEVVAYDIATIADTVSKANGGTFESLVTLNGGGTFEDTATFNATMSIEEVIEKVTPQTSTTGTINFDCLTQAIENYTVDQTADRTVNFRGDSSTTLDSVMGVDESMTFTLVMKQGGTAYYLSVY